METPYHINEIGRSRSARWVCPNDRHLALRAKLKTGWSVKSSSLDSRYDEYQPFYSTGLSSSTTSLSSPCSSTLNTYKNSPLTDEERQRIIEVIQRAEALDQSEQERVGKLVERLDNMKRNVLMVTSTRSGERNCGSRCIRANKCICCCALCGEKFTVLGAGPNLCRDCRKYVCHKCGVETTIAPIITSCNIKNSQIDRHHRPTYASTSNLTSHELLVNQTQTSSTKIFLCRICTETREMWKKSGAWFFKSLPKYILPEKKKSRSGLRCATWTLASSSRSLETHDTQDSSSDEDILRENVNQHGSSVASKASSDAAELTSIPKRSDSNNTQFKNKRGSSLDLNNFLIENKTKSISSQIQSSTHNLLSPSQLAVPDISSTLASPTSPLSSPSSLRPSRSSNRLRDQHDKMITSSISGQSPIINHRQPQLGSSDLVDHESKFDGIPKKGLSNQNIAEHLSCDKTNRICASTTESINVSTPDRCCITKTRRRQSINEDNSASEMTDNSRAYIGNSNQYDHDLSPLLTYRYTNWSMTTGIDEEKNYGTLEIVLRYEPTQSSQCLQCKLIRARGLRPMDIHGLADPFCILTVFPTDLTSDAATKLRSKTVHKTRDPEFNEQLNFYGITENDMRSEKALHIIILQDDEAGRDFLGEARFPLRELQPYQTKFYNVSLMNHYPVDQGEDIWSEEMSNGRGRIFLSLSYCTRQQALLVHIQRALNLLAMDSNGLSDPFVKVSLLMSAQQREDNPIKMNQVHMTKSLRESFVKTLTKHQSKQGKKIKKNVLFTHTTKVKWKTLNPEWNEEFLFETQLNDLTNLDLVLTVWDKDFGKKNDFLGSLVLSCNSKGARLRQWIDVMKFPDHRHEASHELSKEIITLYE